MKRERRERERGAGSLTRPPGGLDSRRRVSCAEILLGRGCSRGHRAAVLVERARDCSVLCIH